MTIEVLETTVAPVLEKYSLTAQRDADKLILRDKKRVVIGSVNVAGEVERKQQGARQLMGALIRDDLKNLFS